MVSFFALILNTKFAVTNSRMSVVNVILANVVAAEEEEVNPGAVALRAPLPF